VVESRLESEFRAGPGRRRVAALALSPPAVVRLVDDRALEVTDRLERGVVVVPGHVASVPPGAPKPGTIRSAIATAASASPASRHVMAQVTSPRPGREPGAPADPRSADPGRGHNGATIPKEPGRRGGSLRLQPLPPARATPGVHWPVFHSPAWLSRAADRSRRSTRTGAPLVGPGLPRPHPAYSGPDEARGPGSPPGDRAATRSALDRETGAASREPHRNHRGAAKRAPRRRRQL